VLCMWAAPVRSPITARTLLNRRRTWAGLAMPVVSDSPASSTPAPTASPAIQTTSSSVTSPWIVQRRRSRCRPRSSRRARSRRAGERWPLSPRSSARASCARWPSCAPRWPTRGWSACARLHAMQPRRRAGWAPMPSRSRRGGQRVPHHLGRIGHLRQQLGRHERADLDLAKARRPLARRSTRTWRRWASRP